MVASPTPGTRSIQLHRDLSAHDAALRPASSPWPVPGSNTDDPSAMTPYTPRGAITPCRGGSVVEFQVLGPLEVRTAGGAAVPLTGPKRRALLGLFVLNAGEVVPAARLADELWQGAPPKSVSTTLQTFIYQLRRRYGVEELVTTPSGYLLDAKPEQIDAHQFERAVDDARATAADQPRRAMLALAGALQMWRGPAYAEFASEPWAIVEAARLEQLRLEAVEAWAASAIGASETRGARGRARVVDDPQSAARIAVDAPCRRARGGRAGRGGAARRHRVARGAQRRARRRSGPSIHRRRERGASRRPAAGLVRPRRARSRAYRRRNATEDHEPAPRSSTSADNAVASRHDCVRAADRSVRRPVARATGAGARARGREQRHAADRGRRRGAGYR